MAVTDFPLPRFTPRRELGRTGFIASRIGIGDVADRSVKRDDLVYTLHRAMDAGLNVIDTAPGYEDGYSEEVVGRALQGRRDGMFLIDKIDFIDQPIEAQVDASLARLGVEQIDAMVFHGISKLEQWEGLSAPGGGFDQLAECVRKGKIRFRGISCHHPEVLRKAIPSGLCDVGLFAIGPAVDRRYTAEILPLAKSHRVGTVCFKTFGAGKLLGDTLGYGRPLQERPRGKVGSGGVAVLEKPELPHLDVETCVRYTLTQDPDVALLGMSFPNEQDAALRAAAAFRPLTAEELADVESRAEAAIANKGRIHWNPDITKAH